MVNEMDSSGHRARLHLGDRPISADGKENGMVRDLFPRMGFALVEETAERASYQLPIQILYLERLIFRSTGSLATQPEILAKM